LFLAIDTGATRTILRPSILSAAGYDLRRTAGRAELTTAGGVVEAPLVFVHTLGALGYTTGVSAAAHELPPRFIGHGLLGRDFFAGLVLTIDFSRSVVTLRPPGRRWWPFAR
jgi:predicted aspartyl protease